MTKKIFVIYGSLVIVLSTMLGAGLVFYTPFHQYNWEQQINGSVGNILATGTSYYVTNYTIVPAYDHQNNPGNQVYNFYINKINADTGHIAWRSGAISYRGIESVFFSDNTNGPQLWSCNHTLFAMDYSTTSDIFHIQNFTIYLFNETTGQSLGSQVISFTWGNVTDSTGILGGWVKSFNSRLYLSFITETAMGSGSTFSENATFHTIYYTLSGGIYRQYGSAEIPMQPTSGFGTSSTLTSASESMLAFHFIWTNSTIVENLATGEFKTLQVAPDAISVLNNEAYLGEAHNGTFTLYGYGFHDSLAVVLFNYHDNVFSTVNNNTNVGLSVLPDGHIAVTVSRYVTNSTTAYPGKVLRFLGFSHNGSVIWNLTLPYPDGVQMNLLSGNMLLLSSETTNLSAFPSSHAYFVEVNYSTGSVAWKNTYYSFLTRNGQYLFPSPIPFYRALASNNGSLVYVFGNSIACANVPD